MAWAQAVEDVRAGRVDADVPRETPACLARLTWVNARKNSRRADKYARERPGKPVKGKFGEPKHWDGLSSLFLVLAGAVHWTAAEKAWRQALRGHLNTAGCSSCW